MAIARAAVVAVLVLSLAGCVIGSKDDLRSLMRTIFQSGFHCAQIDPARTVEECWAKYRDIIER